MRKINRCAAAILFQYYDIVVNFFSNASINYCKIRRERRFACLRIEIITKDSRSILLSFIVMLWSLHGTVHPEIFSFFRQYFSRQWGKTRLSEKRFSFVRYNLSLTILLHVFLSCFYFVQVTSMYCVKWPICKIEKHTCLFLIRRYFQWSFSWLVANI